MVGEKYVLSLALDSATTAPRIKKHRQVKEQSEMAMPLVCGKSGVVSDGLEGQSHSD